MLSPRKSQDERILNNERVDVHYCGGVFFVYRRSRRNSLLGGINVPLEGRLSSLQGVGTLYRFTWRFDSTQIANLKEGDRHEQREDGNDIGE